MKDNIKKLENSYCAIMFLICIFGVIALILSISAYCIGLEPRADSEVHLKNVLFNIILYPVIFIALSFISSFISRPLGDEKKDYKFFSSLIALFRISKNNKLDKDCKDIKLRRVSILLTLLSMIAAFFSFLCLYTFETTFIINIYGAIWQIVIVLCVLALIIALHHAIVAYKIKRIN